VIRICAAAEAMRKQLEDLCGVIGVVFYVQIELVGFSSVNDRLFTVIIHVNTDAPCPHLVADKLFRQLIEMFAKGFREVLHVYVTKLTRHFFQRIFFCDKHRLAPL